MRNVAHIIYLWIIAMVGIAGPAPALFSNLGPYPGVEAE
jgi:hypothetical protein